MSDTRPALGGEEAGGFDWGFDGHRRRQARLGLQLSPAERLRWLEETMGELRRLFETMRSLGIKSVFAFDRHFSEQGFTCVP